MTVKIHTPTIHEVTQAVYNLNATKHLMTWHEHILAGTKPLMDALQMCNFDPDAPRTAESLLDNYVEHNPLAHAPRPFDILDQPGDVGQDMLDHSTVPFVLRAPDVSHFYYMAKTEVIAGKKYTFYRRCDKNDRPEEGGRT